MTAPSSQAPILASERPSKGKYYRAPADKGSGSVPTPVGVIRVTSKGSINKYVDAALDILSGPPLTASAKVPSVTVCGVGAASSKVVTVAEILRRRVAGLASVNDITAEEVYDLYLPRAPTGTTTTTTTTDPSSTSSTNKNVPSSTTSSSPLPPVKVRSLLVGVSITLAKQGLNAKAPGYQSPLPRSQIQPQAPLPSPAATSVSTPNLGNNGKQNGGASTHTPASQQTAPISQGAPGNGNSKKRNGNNKGQGVGASAPAKVPTSLNQQQPKQQGQQGQQKKQGQGQKQQQQQQQQQQQKPPKADDKATATSTTPASRPGTKTPGASAPSRVSSTKNAAPSVVNQNNKAPKTTPPSSGGSSAPKTTPSNTNPAPAQGPKKPSFPARGGGAMTGGRGGRGGRGGGRGGK